MVDVLLGLQWGDEGKGKIVDYLAPNYGCVARFQGGPNAGHTLILPDGRKHVLHTVPSGIFRSGMLNLIGNGVVIDPITLKVEIEKLDLVGVDYIDRLFVSRKAHLILPTHRMLDAASEASKGKEKIGSTLRGIGPTYMDKTGRNGLRIGDTFLPDFKERYEKLKEKHLTLLKIYNDISFDLAAEEAKWFEALEYLKKLKYTDAEYFVHDFLNKGGRILAEGAQGSMLDVDFGTYPFVTSSNTITAGVCNGLGVAPQRIGEVFGITKAYCTRVGSGPFPTELLEETGERLRQAGGEFGSTTGRPRRCGWIDIPQLKYSIMLSGVTQLMVTKIDVLDDFEELNMATNYKVDGTVTDRFPYDLNGVDVEPVFKAFNGWKQDLTKVTDYNTFPDAAKNYLDELEAYIGTPITMVSVGPGREQLIKRK